MDEKFQEKLNAEIERYKKALLFFARVCDWESFRANAAKLFEYLESVEVSLLKKKFYRAVTIILIAIAAAVGVFSILSRNGGPFFEKYRVVVALGAAVGLFFELLLVLEMQLYLSFMASRQKRREARFIKGITDDAKAYLKTETCGTTPQQPA